MLIRFLKRTEIDYKNWILNGFSAIKKIEGVLLTDNEKNEISRDLHWAADENNTWHNVLICEENENIVGYCWYLKQKIFPCGGYSYGDLSKPYIWVHSIYTDPNTTRKGVATLLYSKFEEISKTEKVERIYLDVHPSM